MINDSGIEIDQEFMREFLSDSFVVLDNLKRFVTSFEEPSQKILFEQYGQQIDRIMGAAYTLSLNELGDLAKMGKELGYKSSQLTELSQLITAQSLLSQLTRSIESILKDLSKGRRPDFDQYKTLLRRLQSASKQMGDLRTTVSL